MENTEIKNLQRAKELHEEQIKHLQRVVSALTPKEVESVIAQLERFQIDKAKNNTTNDLAWAYVVLFGLIIIVVYATTALMITSGYAEMLEKIEKLNFVVLSGGMTLMAYLGGYYFSQKQKTGDN